MSTPPTPTPTGIEAEVCADIARRQQLGLIKYGTTVADNPLELPAWLNHAYEEALDLAIYLKRAHSETRDAWCPDTCPITREGFFAWITHPERGLVPTYGGPYDSYTIPTMEGKPYEPWHHRQLTRERYDHDEGAWIEGGEVIPLLVVHEDVLLRFDDLKEATLELMECLKGGSHCQCAADKPKCARCLAMEKATESLKWIEKNENPAFTIQVTASAPPHPHPPVDAADTSGAPSSSCAPHTSSS